MIQIQEEIKKLIAQTLTDLNFSAIDFNVLPSSDLAHGDYATNVALILAKQTGQTAKEIAEQIVEQVLKTKDSSLGPLKVRPCPWLGKIEVAGVGFINFYLADNFLVENLREILKLSDDYGHGNLYAGRKVMIEYTDPNPFKEFHIGHLMSNTIGETISRLIEFQGAEVKRACYQGDVGLHVAKAIYGSLKLKAQNLKEIKEWGEAYVIGAEAYETDEQMKAEINEINKKVYAKSDAKINELYNAGRKLSLEYFETIYQRLGTKFDFYFFESETGEFGRKLVEENVDKIFESSNGAIVFHAEKYDPKLHTRVFITKENLPTYEAKELGLAKIKFDRYPYDESVVVTGNEVNAYFDVLLQALKLIYPDLAPRTKHLGHGMLRLPTGKMSSRAGGVITAEDLLMEIKNDVERKMSGRNFSTSTREAVMEAVAVAAIKYSILRQVPGHDVIFNPKQSISFEGDSGPYLQYALVRARAVLEKARVARIQPGFESEVDPPGALEHQLIHFSEIAVRATREFAPNLLVGYLTELSSTFNSYYALTPIAESGNPQAPYRVALTSAVVVVLQNGLRLLGLPSPTEM